VARQGATHDDESTPEFAAQVYANDPTRDHFADIVAEVCAEYTASDSEPATDSVPSPAAVAAKLAAKAHGYGARSMIDFDGDDEVEVEYDSFEQDDPHGTPIDLIRLAAHADAASPRTVRYRDGAGAVRVYVEVDGRRD